MDGTILTTITDSKQQGRGDIPSCLIPVQRTGAPAWTGPDVSPQHGSSNRRRVDVSVEQWINYIKRLLTVMVPIFPFECFPAEGCRGLVYVTALTTCEEMKQWAWCGMYCILVGLNILHILATSSVRGMCTIRSSPSFHALRRLHLTLLPPHPPPPTSPSSSLLTSPRVHSTWPRKSSSSRVEVALSMSYTENLYVGGGDLSIPKHLLVCNKTLTQTVEKECLLIGVFFLCSLHVLQP